MNIKGYTTLRTNGKYNLKNNKLIDIYNCINENEGISVNKIKAKNCFGNKSLNEIMEGLVSLIRHGIVKDETKLLSLSK